MGFSHALAWRGVPVPFANQGPNLSLWAQEIRSRTCGWGLAGLCLYRGFAQRLHGGFHPSWAWFDESDRWFPPSEPLLSYFRFRS